MKRASLRVTPNVAKLLVKVKRPSKRKCCICKLKPPINSMATVCSIACATEKAVLDRIKAARIAAKLERAADKAKLEQYKPLEYWLKKAEVACNKYIRARDPDVCISCGVTKSSAWQAGHYVSVGANKTLRYHEDNIHKQCIQCNMFKGSNATEYRVRLLEKIGIERVEWLESWHSPVKMTREAAEEIEALYKTKLRALLAGNQIGDE